MGGRKGIVAVGLQWFAPRPTLAGRHSPVGQRVDAPCSFEEGVAVGGAVHLADIDAYLAGQVAIVGPRVGPHVAGAELPPEIGREHGSDIVLKVAGPAVGLGDGQTVAAFVEDQIRAIDVGGESHRSNTDSATAAGRSGSLRGQEVVGLRSCAAEKQACQSTKSTKFEELGHE